MTGDRWTAEFVSAPEQVGDLAAYLRREFTADAGLRRATLHVTALGVVEPHLNGERVGDEVLEPGWTSYRHRLVVRSHDVTEQVHTGVNAVGAIVGDGWAVGRLGYTGIGRRRIYADRPALFLQLDLDYGDHVETIRSDPSFRAGTGAVRENSLYDGETVDARCEPHGWDEPGFDETGWSGVQVVEWDPATLVAPMAPGIRRIEELAPVAVTTAPSGVTVVDFGQNIAGRVRLRTSGAAGQTITVRHAEVLVGGEPAFEPLRTAAATDRFVLAGSGVEEFEPRFTVHGFRYATVAGHCGPLDITAVVVHTDMVRTGWFETSNELVNRLHQNVVWSMRGNFVGLPTDCPQRDERLGWTGDLNAFGPTAAFLYDVRGVLGSWLADLAAEQAERGFVPWIVPDIRRTVDRPTALWSDVAVSLPWTLYQAYGDREILERSYDSMAAFVRDVAGRLDERGLWSNGFQFGDWLDPDAPPDNPTGGKTDPHLVACAYFAKVTREMAETARILGRDAEHFATLADRVRQAFRDEYLTPNGRVLGESATGYALAIMFDLLDPTQLATAGRRLAQAVRAAGHRISTGFAGTPLVAHALSATGHLDDAYRLLLQQQPPSFLYPVTMGATTIWERWDALRPDGTVHPSEMTSFNHYALGAVADWLYRVVGGIAPAEPGYRALTIAPRPGGDLSWARAAHDTPRGRVEVSWQLADATFTVEVTVPDGVPATIELPDGKAVEVVGGRHTLTCPMPVAGSTIDMNTPLRELAAIPALWAAISEMFERRMPHVPLAQVAEHSDASCALLVDNLPSMPVGLAEELAAILAAR